MSANELMLDIGQIHELELAFRRSGWTNADIKALSEGDFLTDVLKLMNEQKSLGHKWNIKYFSCLSCVLKREFCGPLKNTGVFSGKELLAYLAACNVRDTLFEKSKTIFRKNIVDCDSLPFVPFGYSVEEHRKGGNFEFNSAKFSLYFSSSQDNGGICGHDLYKELSDKQLWNANALDYFLQFPELIPKEFKMLKVFFWGTIYRNCLGSLYVRCLEQSASGWIWSFRWLGSNFNHDCPAMIG